MAKNTAKLTELSILAPHTQMELFAITEVEIDGVVMGVLSDGTPYLTLRGLARMCGVDHKSLGIMATNWAEEQLKPRGAKIKELLAANGHQGDILNLQTGDKGTHVYTDTVCMAVLEYYAFEATKGSNDTATKNYRLLARKSFRAFIYQQCGYDPDRHIPDSWRNFHERVLLNDQIPAGHFSVFREMADIVVHMIKAGCPLDSHTVPDISVGLLWSKFWEANEFMGAYGPRTKYPHVYPDWFPQSNAGPIPAWIYPISALGAFHGWLQASYIPQKFPAYVDRKVATGVFLPGRANKLLSAVVRQPLAIPPPRP